MANFLVYGEDDKKVSNQSDTVNGKDYATLECIELRLDDMETIDSVISTVDKRYVHKGHNNNRIVYIQSADVIKDCLAASEQVANNYTYNDIKRIERLAEYHNIWYNITESNKNKIISDYCNKYSKDKKTVKNITKREITSNLEYTGEYSKDFIQLKKIIDFAAVKHPKIIREARGSEKNLIPENHPIYMSKTYKSNTLFGKSDNSMLDIVNQEGYDQPDSNTLKLRAGMILCGHGTDIPDTQDSIYRYHAAYVVATFQDGSFATIETCATDDENERTEESADLHLYKDMSNFFDRATELIKDFKPKVILLEPVTDRNKENIVQTNLENNMGSMTISEVQKTDMTTFKYDYSDSSSEMSSDSIFSHYSASNTVNNNSMEFS